MPVAPKLIAASALPESARVRIRLRFKSRRIPCALGRITRKTQTLSNGNTRSIGYQYDASGTASTSVTHQYDAAGKLQSDGLHQYHYDSQGRLKRALLHKSEGRRDYPSPRRSYAMAPTGTVLGRPSCVKRLSRATRTCNSTTCRSNVRAITRWPRRLKQCILVSTRLLR